MEIEASYMFPLDERAAVCGFEAEIAGKRIVGTAKEKQQAKRFFFSSLLSSLKITFLFPSKNTFLKIFLTKMNPFFFFFLILFFV